MSAGRRGRRGGGGGGEEKGQSECCRFIMRDVDSHPLPAAQGVMEKVVNALSVIHIGFRAVN